ncbi:MAG: ECF-type sigma factor [Phycisphaerae bacterium]|nr:ECF-type sigma factor [Phycisphaerae bacterium]
MTMLCVNVNEGRSNDLLAASYDELRRLAGAYLRSERPDHTLQPTALVHEAWCRLAGRSGREGMTRDDFVAAAAQAMRRILVDHARAHRATKRGGATPTLAIDAVDAPTSKDTGAAVDVLALDEALERLRSLSETQATIVELRFFGGLSLEEAAVLVGVPRRTADREWACAKAWLHRALSAD